MLISPNYRSYLRFKQAKQLAKNPRVRQSQERAATHDCGAESDIFHHIKLSPCHGNGAMLHPSSTWQFAKAQVAQITHPDLAWTLKILLSSL